MHDKLYNVKEMLVDKLEEYSSRQSLSASDIEMVDTLAHAAKNMCKIIEAAEEEQEYSQRGADRRYSYDSSYARGRGRNARRDSMGRYSSEGNGNRYSRDGYSRSEDMVTELRELMMDTDDEQMKSEFQRFIKKIESM